MSIKKKSDSTARPARAAVRSKQGRARRKVAAPPIVEIPGQSLVETVSGASFPIVGLGASAGGLEALTHLFRNMPGDCGMAFVVVQHLDPTQKSMLTDLLGKASPMPVREVRDGMAVRPNCVYVIPPNTSMEISGGVLELTPREDAQQQHRPIDTFFYSLARDQKNRAFGVILSGTASDGALGLKAVKEEGGITFAQERESAKFDGMPAAAIAGGGVDFVLRPEQIAKELVHIARHPYLAHPVESLHEADRVFDNDSLEAIFARLRAVKGVDFTYYKHSTIKRRILRRMMLNRIERLPDYIERLEHQAEEVTALYNDFLINVTQFFRDGRAFEALKTTVFPELSRHRTEDAALRIWVPGCAGGEEAYSIAICLEEYFGHAAARVPVQIFATDVSEMAIEKARMSIYPDSAMVNVSADRQRRFFVKTDGGHQVTRSLREMCVFAKHDLTRDPPFSRLDLISCRNVLIYLGATLQKRIIPAFHYALMPEGFLMLGTSESIGTFADLFALADKEHKIYRRKTAVTRRHLETEFGFHAAHAEVRHHAPAGGATESTGVEREADRMMLNRFAPPGVLINEEMNILQFRGQTGRYLEPAPGTASLHLLRMARPELQVGLRKAVTEALRRGSPVKVKELRLRVDGNRRDVNVEAIPVAASPAASGHFFLVLFDEVRTPGVPPARGRAAGAGRRRKGEDPEMGKLRQELEATRAYLQSVIEEQEAANEELRSANEESHSTNEELQSINEEMETAKEELQSTNEELNTMNAELQAVNQELIHANNDLKNLFDGVDIAIVILDKERRIRRFTPTAAKLLNLIPTDMGRPLGDIRPSIDMPGLEQLIQDVVDNLTHVHQVVHDRDGRAFVLRIKPYRTGDNASGGAVMSLVDSHGGVTA